MLETSQERVELLKAGITGKEIEELYLTLNDFNMMDKSFYLEMVEFFPYKNTVMKSEGAA